MFGEDRQTAWSKGTKGAVLPAERFYQKMQGPAPKDRSGWATQKRRGKGEG